MGGDAHNPAVFTYQNACNDMRESQDCAAVPVIDMDNLDKAKNHADTTDSVDDVSHSELAKTASAADTEPGPVEKIRQYKQQSKPRKKDTARPAGNGRKRRRGAGSAAHMFGEMRHDPAKIRDPVRVQAEPHQGLTRADHAAGIDPHVEDPSAVRADHA